MKPHLLSVSESPGAFAELFAAAKEAKLRIGWLEFAPPAPLPSSLEEAASLGALRAVAVGDRWSVAIKRLSGESVREDLLREHFRGCALVLVRGGSDVPDLTAFEKGWRVRMPSGAAIDLETTALLARLRRPRPWE